jgi:hypothetical protein
MVSFFIKRHHANRSDIWPRFEWLIIVEQDNGKKYVLFDFNTYESARKCFKDTILMNLTARNYYPESWEYLVGPDFKRCYLP